MPTDSSGVIHRHPEAVPDLVLGLENVSVVYRVNKERITSLKEYAIKRVRRQVTHEQFWALRNVSVELARGEVFGIVGRNGAGKSTMLKVLAKVLRPTEGRVWVKGHVAPLLEMGAGFHPELSGRENVYLYGSLLGFTREQMDSKFERIVDFAEVWDFIDNPLRTYSTGMVTRLGFSIATDVQPDVLIVDEILGVGDESFQRKSRARMLGFCKEGATVILVSHNRELMQSLCDRILWLDHGTMKMIGPAEEVATAYHEANI
ncbi:MAG: ABC transporter ATP-binding protein [Coriobacteriia bacterium]|nr:ABC transporter ATP-binding protein [Coriobacteriia bacterium]